jgi:hypothetical protein
VSNKQPNEASGLTYVYWTKRLIEDEVIEFECLLDKVSVLAGDFFLLVMVDDCE